MNPQEQNQEKTPYQNQPTSPSNIKPAVKDKNNDIKSRDPAEKDVDEDTGDTE